MNTTVIVLGIIIVFLVYLLFKYFTNTSISLKTEANMNTLVPGIKVNNPQATRYAYGIWVYVNTWNTNVDHTIFSRNNNIKLYLDRTAPTLKCQITMNDTTVKKDMIITDNFPLQKWVNIVISVDNQFVDAYLDGKLIQSSKFLFSTTNNGINVTNTPNQPPDVNTLMYVGNAPANNGWDAYASKFKQWSTGPVDPQTVWSYYMEGNGGNILSSTLGNYGINVQLLKNNVENSKIQVF
jgi:hypothetical protein